MQKIWFVIYSLDQVLSANVLAIYLSGEGSSELNLTPNASFESLKTRLARASKTLEPFIALPNTNRDKGFVLNTWIQKHLKGGK